MPNSLIPIAASVCIYEYRKAVPGILHMVKIPDIQSVASRQQEGTQQRSYWTVRSVMMFLTLRLLELPELAQEVSASH